MSSVPLDLFAGNVLMNLPCWVSTFFLMLAAARSYVKPPRGRTAAIALAVLVAVGVVDSAIITAQYVRFGLNDGNVQTIVVLVLFYLTFRLSTTLPRRKLLFVYFSGMAVTSFTVLASDIVLTCFTGALPTAVRTAIDVAVSVALPLCLLPLFTGRMRWSLEQLEDGAWRGLWLVPIAFFGVAVGLYVMRFAVAFVEPWAQEFYALTGVLVVALLAVAYWALFATMQSMQENARLKAEAQLAALESSRYATLRDHMRETAQARHDFRHRLLVLRALADEGDLEGLRGALDDESLTDAAPERGMLCANFAVDAVAAHFLARARAGGIDMRCELALPERLPVAESDFCLALANLLENAVEACERLDGNAGRRVYARASVRGEALVLRVENPCERRGGGAAEGGGRAAVEGRGSAAAVEGDALMESGSAALEADALVEGIPSTKHAGTGVGLASVASIARKHRGDVRVERGDGTFAVSAVFRG